jgi:mycofactocin precursor
METQVTEPVVTRNDEDEVDAGEVASKAAPEPLISADLLVEDVSIDGMCGVY